jgi:methionyl-tRNA formyltransferase
MPEQEAGIIKKYVSEIGISSVGYIASSQQDLLTLIDQGVDLVLSFATSIIVDSNSLKHKYTKFVNVHSATPNFPGRDPHHFAIYNESKIYGATIHYMNEKVDSGKIINVVYEKVPIGATPGCLLRIGNEASLKLIKKFFLDYLSNGWPLPNNSYNWSGITTKRLDFTKLCEINPGIDKLEFEKRYKATYMPGYSNLFINIHGKKFMIQEEQG